jgi:hypothetical protein
MSPLIGSGVLDEQIAASFRPYLNLSVLYKWEPHKEKGGAKKQMWRDCMNDAVIEVLLIRG